MVESEPEEYLLVMYIWYGFVYRLDLVWNNRQGKCENPQGQLLPGAGEGAGCPVHDARHGRYETPGENHLSFFYLGLEKVLEKVLDVLYMKQGMDTGQYETPSENHLSIFYLLPGAGEGARCPLHDARH